MNENGIPMRFDYSKTINEQLPTFNYYKDRYCYDVLKIIILQQENEQLKIQISAREEEYKKLEDNWNKLKEYIDIKLYNVEYLQKLCGCRIDDEIHMILDIIQREIQELEQGDDSNEKDN